MAGGVPEVEAGGGRGLGHHGGERGPGDLQTQHPAQEEDGAEVGGRGRESLQGNVQEKIREVTEKREEYHRSSD